MESVNDRFGYIYKITNKVNGKVYIGKRKSSTLDESYWGTGVKLRNALNEFGENNFSKEILEWCSTEDILKERERYWILYEDSRNPEKGYNIKPGSEPTVKSSKNANSKKIIGVQVDVEMENEILDLAAEFGTNISSVIRMILLDYLKRYKNYKPTRKERK